MKQLYKWGGVIASLLLASALVFSGCSSGSDSESSGGGETSATSGGTSGGESGGGSGGESGGSGGGGGVSLSTPLTLKALTAGTIVVDNPKSGMQYSKNGGDKTAMTEETTTIDVAIGDTVAFYGSGTSITEYFGTFIADGTAEVKAYGNIMSLVDETGFATDTALAYMAFNCLFKGNAKLKDAGELLLPATTLASDCYSCMFSGCTSLTAAPALPATSLAYGCYEAMFDGCTSLTAAPALPATTLMPNCYEAMFDGCTSLTAAPALPATTLETYCYNGMFFNCTSLKAVTCLATDVSATSCTKDWLNSAGTNVTGEKTFTTPSGTNWSSGNSGIPDGWTRVDAN